ncbi:ciliary microtubule associated protein 1A-like [Haliaeetus albicilla]|uniref:ciliary microtubule associated protein 1A-like n=1 Tax=Haliaeetus albicilla TaxID=8969 RepID=UPI0037E762E9
MRYRSREICRYVHLRIPFLVQLLIVTALALDSPGTYTLPRLAGPNTAYTHASPCYSMKGKSKHNGFAEDLSKTPGPAAFPKVELDIYKKRAPMYTKGAKSRIGGDKTVKPGPADYCLGEGFSELKTTLME